MEAWPLVSTSGVLRTADYVFYCMLNDDVHIPVGIKLSLPLDTGDNVLVGRVRWWVRHELSPSVLSGFEASTPVCPYCLFMRRMLPGVDESQHVCSGVPAWAQSPGAHLGFHTSPRLMCLLKVLPHESGPCPAAPRDQHGCRFQRLWRGRWLPLHTCSHSLADLVSRDWPDPGQRFIAAGPRVTGPLRTQCSIQTALPLLPTSQLPTL